MATSPIELLERASEALEPLEWEFVFVGGATVSLYLDDPAAGDIRATKDVDCVVSVSTYAQYAAVEEALRRHGFTQLDQEHGPICRWSKDELLLDILPVAPELLGFDESRWFREGFRTARTRTLPSGREIRIFEPRYLLAAKIEAYEDRAGGDYLLSKDFEDIATILDARSSIFDELSEEGEVETFVRNWFDQFELSELEEMLGSHVRDYDRGRWLAERLAEILAATDN